MPYNKVAQYKWIENNPEVYKVSTRKAALKYRQTHIEIVREKDRLYKRNFNEFKRLRNIDLF